MTKLKRPNPVSRESLRFMRRHNKPTHANDDNNKMKEARRFLALAKKAATSRDKIRYLEIVLDLRCLEMERRAVISEKIEFLKGKRYGRKYCRKNY